jgi:hypothetical protein
VPLHKPAPLVRLAGNLLCTPCPTLPPAEPVILPDTDDGVWEDTLAVFSGVRSWVAGWAVAHPYFLENH